MYDDFHDLHREVHPVALLARKNSAQTLVSGTWTTLLYNVVDWDPHSAYTPATGIYLCQHAGIYRISAAYLLDATTAFATRDVCLIAIYLNAVRIFQMHRRDDWSLCGAVQVYARVQGTGYIYCAKGDAITIIGRHLAGVNLSIYTANPAYNYMQVERVAPYYP